MNDDDKKDKLIFDLLSDKGLREGEGVQRLAHAMTAPLRANLGSQQNSFVYKKPEPGWSERAQANGYRELARTQGGNPLIERIADSWDRHAEYKENLAKTPRIIQWFIKRIDKLRGIE
jgi:hypothetical protein